MIGYIVFSIWDMLLDLIAPPMCANCNETRLISDLGRCINCRMLEYRFDPSPEDIVLVRRVNTKTLTALGRWQRAYQLKGVIKFMRILLIFRQFL